MHWASTRRRIARCRRHVIELSLATSCNLDFRSNSVAIALRSLQRDFQPVVITGTIVDPDFRRSAQRGHHNIEFAVVVEIGNRGSAVSAGRLLREASFGRESIPPAVSEISKNCVVLIDKNAAGHVGRSYVPTAD